ncbi:MAG: hypothetical protein BA861_09325 [Desulfobacterales bacterium S3730MH5]|nr:MAG: hypothetical protein BA861_09325 [Desulfobacterales bacterium S3730MH5]OEU79006.1 MAG: hypothetical protein BA865_04595 [Desulfobacterales bacterium S5133MH4]
MQKRLPIFALCLFLLISGVTWAQDARISDVIVTNTRDDLVLYFRIQDCFTKKLEEAILNGVPTTFTFLASLYRVRDFWKDENLASLEVHHTVKYDNLKNEFVITRSEHGDKPVIVNTLSEVKKIMAEIKDLKIAKLESLERNQLYQVRIKAELSKITLPFYLHHIFRFFLFLWDFETDWYTTDFIF